MLMPEISCDLSSRFHTDGVRTVIRCKQMCRMKTGQLIVKTMILMRLYQKCNISFVNLQSSTNLLDPSAIVVTSIQVQIRLIIPIIRDRLGANPSIC